MITYLKRFVFLFVFVFPSVVLADDETAPGWLGGIVKPIVDTIKWVVAQIVKFINSLIKAVTDAVNWAVNYVLDLIYDAFEWIYDKAMEILEKAVEWMPDLSEKIPEGFKDAMETSVRLFTMGDKFVPFTEICALVGLVILFVLIFIGLKLILKIIPWSIG